MSEVNTRFLPENAYRTLKPGEKYEPIVRPAGNTAGANHKIHRMGIVFLRNFHGRLGVLGIEGRAGDGIGDTDFDSGDWFGATVQAALRSAGKCDYHGNRGSGWISGGGRGVHRARTVHPEAFSTPRANDFHLPGGRMPWRFISDPAAALFRAREHGELPYPEATAITEVLVTGEKGGSQAKLLLQATAVAGVYDFLVTTFQVWKESLDFQFVPVVRMVSERARMVLGFDAIGFILGLGYVMGLRSSMILCAGGVLSNFVLVPLIWFVGSHLDSAVYPAAIPIAKMTAVQIYTELRKVCRRRSNRHRRNFWDREVSADCGWFFRNCATRVSQGRGASNRADRS